MSFFESIFYMAWRGIAIGLIISAPMGPVGMLCIQRTLDKGRRAGFYTGVGAAISDLFYALLTGFGLSFIEEFLERNQNIIQLAGSAVLIAFGIYLFRRNPSRDLRKPVEEGVSIKKSILGGFLFTFSNPLILFLIIGLFARFNFLLPEFHLYQYLTGFAFIYVGALLWWWLITFSIDKVRNHFNIRSMWLINKIIGGIILIFAIVGIITATAALVSAHTHIQCWNAKRGFGPFSSDENLSLNKLENENKAIIRFLTPCEKADFVEFRCKVKSENPAIPWGFVLKRDDPAEQSEENFFITFKNTESDFDGFSTSQALEVKWGKNDTVISSKKFIDNSGLIIKAKKGTQGLDPSGTQNFYKISVAGNRLTLFGGIHTPEIVFVEDLPAGFRTDSIGFFLYPGAKISPDEIRLTTMQTNPQETIWTDSDFLDEYLSGSWDVMEGYWQILDRSLDESLLRLGGDYKYAIVRSLDGYDLIYLSGAKINPENWRRGMLKAHFTPSGIKDIWDVTWFDAMGQPMQHELKAQTDTNGILTLQFPYQNSQIRLLRTN